MKKNELLIENVQEIMKLQAWLKQSGEYLNTMYKKVETDDPLKKDALFEPLNKAYDAMWDSVDKLQHNAEKLIEIGQAIEELKN